jgi:hypothetical protein
MHLDSQETPARQRTQMTCEAELVPKEQNCNICTQATSRNGLSKRTDSAIRTRWPGYGYAIDRFT